MPAPTSNELRRCVIRMLALELDIPLIMAVTSLSERTISKIRQQWEETGSYRHEEQYGIIGRPRLLSVGDIWYLTERITQAPDLFLDELRQELSVAAGIDVSISTVWRSLARLGITYKVLDKRAMERCEADRAEYQRLIRAFRPSQLVFVDESSFNRRGTYRNRGYAISGDRACKKAFFARGKRYSILPALSITGILATLIVQKSFNSALFLEFLELCLASMNPFPDDNSVLIMDNCAIHNDPAIREMIEARGMVCMYLPSYSPDFNPIELAFSKIKSSVQRSGEAARLTFDSNDENYEAEIQALFFRHVHTVTEEDARGWYRHCGYDYE
ncbi:hypothetical protein CTheo_5590 [Ceratobasidium theobromae]|uniref:Tc1-like transposase DDE domain-containing protein n=1 Tax=Ceratobasidium theobromae TaxID=1582974 RepID=A0A5N5QH24_9AGAM|nr:hypothetical protein CTheo_5590 [Ceratobasidium theobromae]